MKKYVVTRKRVLSNQPGIRSVCSCTKKEDAEIIRLLLENFERDYCVTYAIKRV